ncbi:MAG: hypothetical protein IPJ00_17555 [Saprospirales bacterium]|nr:hypothetical protein [Saprospirales bacterium]
MFPGRKDIDLQDFSFPDAPGEMVLFYDDFNQFADLVNLTEVLEQALLNPNIWVVATCRKDRLDFLEDRVTDIYHNFDIIEILPLNEPENIAIENQRQFKRNLKSDGTIGGYLLPINEMRKRFRNLSDGGLEKEILHACKALHYWGKIRFNGGYSKENIKDYCQKMGLLFRKDSEFGLLSLIRQ